MPSLVAIVLAAGHGTRMSSQLPKVLHGIAGRPLLYYPIRAAFEAGAERAVIVTSGQEAIERELLRLFPPERLVFATQSPPRGTGDAARIGIGATDAERVLIVYGDTPLLTKEELRPLVSALDAGAAPDLAFLTCELENPKGYGRVLREPNGQLRELREDRDLTSELERQVREVNAGVYAARRGALAGALDRLKPDNAQGEYYLTDAVRLLGGARCQSVRGGEDALVGVNDRVQLRAAERRMFERIARRHGAAGVTLRGEVLIDDEVELASDIVIEHGARLRGATRVGRGAFIDVGCVLDAAEIGEEVRLKPYSVITESRVEQRAQIGPFSHLRPDSVIEEDAHIGNFVETKKTIVRRGAKANHLSYLGDGDVGERTNIGAGTIFCNYDGFQKHRTLIGPGTFIGSDSQIVAPVTIGGGVYVASGTAVTDDVPDDALVVGRVRQEIKPGYASKLRERLRDAAKKK